MAVTASKAVIALTDWNCLTGWNVLIGCDCLNGWNFISPGANCFTHCSCLIKLLIAS
jgi:hypothetical protein